MLEKTALSDEQLMDAVEAGDSAAFETLYDRYVRQCFGLALRIVGDRSLAEEVVQEIFLKVWSRPGAYSSEKGKFASWLLSLVHHRCIDELRRRSRTETSLDNGDGGSILDTASDSEPGPGEQVWMREESEAVRSALREITPHQREVIELAYFGGLTQSQIAERLQQPLGTVKTRVRAGLRNLCELLEKRGVLRE